MPFLLIKSSIPIFHYRDNLPVYTQTWVKCFQN